MGNTTGWPKHKAKARVRQRQATTDRDATIEIQLDKIRETFNQKFTNATSKARREGSA